MSDGEIAVFGVYSSREAAGKALEQFQSSGFRDADTSVVLSGQQGAEKVENIEVREPRNVIEAVKDLTSNDTKDISSGVSIHADSREEADRARNIFQQTGASDIAATHEAKSESVETRSLPRAAGR